MEEGNPTFASFELLRLSDKQRPLSLALEPATQIILLIARSNNQQDAGAHDDLGSLQLRTHPPDCRGTISSPGQTLCRIVDLFNSRNDARFRGSKSLHETLDRR